MAYNSKDGQGNMDKFCDISRNILLQYVSIKAPIFII